MMIKLILKKLRMFKNEFVIGEESDDIVPVSITRYALYRVLCVNAPIVRLVVRSC